MATTTYLQNSHTGYGSSTGAKATMSVWVKRADISGDDRSTIIGARTDDSNYFKIRFADDDCLMIYGARSGSANFHIETVAEFRDVLSWYHVLLQIDTTHATEAERVKWYVNGQLQDLKSSGRVYPSQNHVNHLTSASDINIGCNAVGTNEHFDGSMSHFHMIDGTIYPPTAFGSTDAVTGEWKINSSPSVTYGSKGFFILKDGDTITDSSVNSNHFTLGAGTLTKTLDNPSNVFATFNSADNYYAASDFAHGNTMVNTNSGNYTFNNATLGYASGKYYWETKLTGTSNYDHIGVTSKGSIGSTHYMYASDYNFTLKSDNGALKFKAGGSTSDVSGWSGTSFGVGNIISIAHDADNNKIYFAKDGVWMNSANPNTPTGGITSTAASLTDTGFWLPAFGDENNGTYATWQVNFGNGFFGTTAVSTNSGAGYQDADGNGKMNYSVPTGYRCLCTKGLNQ